MFLMETSGSAGVTAILPCCMRMNLPVARKRLGVRQPSGAFDQVATCQKRQRAGAVQNLPAFRMVHDEKETGQVRPNTKACLYALFFDGERHRELGVFPHHFQHAST